MMVPVAPPPRIYLVANNSLAALVWSKENVQTMLRLCRMHRSSCKQRVMTHLTAMACTGTAVAQVSHHMLGRGKALVQLRLHLFQLENRENCHGPRAEMTCINRKLLQPSLRTSLRWHDQPLLHAEKEIYRCNFLSSLQLWICYCTVAGLQNVSHMY